MVTMGDNETPFETDNLDILSSVPNNEPEGSLGARDTATLVVRSVTVVVTLLGGVLLVHKIKRRGRGSWAEALIFITFQLIWQVRFLLVNILCFV